MAKYLLLLVVPVSFGLDYLEVGATWVFLAVILAVALLADRVRRAIEQLAAHADQALPGLMCGRETSCRDRGWVSRSGGKRPRLDPGVDIAR